jgi:hypothetical protein
MAAWIRRGRLPRAAAATSNPRLRSHGQQLHRHRLPPPSPPLLLLPPAPTPRPSRLPVIRGRRRRRPSPLHCPHSRRLPAPAAIVAAGTNGALPRALRVGARAPANRPRRRAPRHRIRPRRTLPRYLLNSVSLSSGAATCMYSRADACMSNLTRLSPWHKTDHLGDKRWWEHLVPSLYPFR